MVSIPFTARQKDFIFRTFSEDHKFQNKYLQIFENELMRVSMPFKSLVGIEFIKV